jgi:hypothetical protein
MLHHQEAAEHVQHSIFSEVAIRVFWHSVWQVQRQRRLLKIPRPAWHDHEKGKKKKRELSMAVRTAICSLRVLATELITADRILS